MMTEEEQLLADSIYQAIVESSRNSERSQQSQRFQAGISDLGYCSERTRRLLRNEVPQDTDTQKAFIGTWLGTGMEAACKLQWGDAVTTQDEVSLDIESTLDGQPVVYTIMGHPDLIFRNGLLVDFKTSDGLTLARREGPTQSKQFQRHCYAKAAHEAGLFDVPLVEVQVANVWMDRSGQEPSLHCQMELYDPEVVVAATQWLDDVIYAFIHNEEARKEPAREVCVTTCGFYEPCRGGEVGGHGLITDPGVVEAVELYGEGMRMASLGDKYKKEAKAVLRGISGSTGKFSVRWTTVPGGSVKPGYRSGYDKIEVKEL